MSGRVLQVMHIKQKTAHILQLLMCNAQTNSPSVSEAVHATGKRGTKGVESEEISSDIVGKLKREEEKQRLI